MTDGLVLALDTSTQVCVGLARDGRLLGNSRNTERLQHVEQLMPLVRRTVEAAGFELSALDLLAVGLGPGPFTGLRVGVVTARMLASVLRIPLHGVCSLDIIAAEAAADATGEFLVAIDARRKELYWARYGADGVRLDGPNVTKPDLLPALPVIGPGAELYADLLTAAPGPSRLDAGVLAVHGRALASAGSEPLYLRRPDAAEPGRRKSVLIRRPERQRQLRP